MWFSYFNIPGNNLHLTLHLMAFVIGIISQTGIMTWHIKKNCAPHKHTHLKFDTIWKINVHGPGNEPM